MRAVWRQSQPAVFFSLSILSTAPLSIKNEVQNEDKYSTFTKKSPQERSIILLVKTVNKYVHLCSQFNRVKTKKVSLRNFICSKQHDALTK